jgi:hypothetical protein
MVERAILTKRIVDEAEAPSRGERWISDVVQRGLGLRVWRSPSGKPRKAYCVRAVDNSGKPARRTLLQWQALHLFRQEHWWTIRTHPDFEPSVGDFIHIARLWAHDELARLKGQLTLAEEREVQRDIGRQRVAALTFSKAMQAVLDGMAHAGLTQAYRDRLYKLFFRHVPIEIANKGVCEVTSADISKVFGCQNLKPGSLRILRPFIGQVLQIPDRFDADTAMSPYDFRTIDQSTRPNPASLAQLVDWRETDFESFLVWLESKREHWQQARCLRLFLHFYCPMSQLLKARWDQLYVVRSGSHSGGGSEARTFLQWRHSDRPSGSETLRGASEKLVRECFERCATEFPKSQFWFPTRSGRGAGHITSIDHVWRIALAEFKLRYVSPRQFRSAYREAYPFHGWLPDFMAALSIRPTTSEEKPT